MFREVKYFILAVCLFHISSLALAQEYSVRGVIVPGAQARLSVELAGKIIYAPYKAGDLFKEGDPLVRLDCGLYEQQSAKVLAELRSNDLRYENNRALLNTNSIGQAELLLSQLELEKSSAEYRMTQLNVQRCVIKAPWTGKVVELSAFEHEFVQSGQEVLKIVASEPLEILILAPAQWLSWLKIGQSFSLTLDENSDVIAAHVDVIGAVIDPVSQTVELRAHISESNRLLPGMSGNALFRLQ